MPGDPNKLQLLMFTKRVQTFGNAAFTSYHKKDGTYVTSVVHTTVQTSRPTCDSSEGGLEYCLFIYLAVLYLFVCLNCVIGSGDFIY